MKTELSMMTTNAQGELVRGFKIGLRGNGRKCLLPCTGCALYTGEQALAIMRQYAIRQPGVEIHAITCSEFAGYEVLTLAEMEDLYRIKTADEVAADVVASNPVILADALKNTTKLNMAGAQ